MGLIRKTKRFITKLKGKKALSTNQQHALIEASKISNKVSAWLENSNYECVSFGENCNSSWYIKETGNKNASYPFDWIFSSPEIIIHALKDEFKSFLNKDHIFPVDKKRAGHVYYHSRMFNHRNPLESDEHYTYYKRAATRLKALLKAQKNVVFIITVINEPEKRKDWSTGFNKKMALPKNQSANNFKPLIEYIKQINPNSKFLFINQFTEQKLNINLSFNDDSIMWIDFTSAGANSGVKYSNKIDDTIIKIVYSGLNDKKNKL